MAEVLREDALGFTRWMINKAAAAKKRYETKGVADADRSGAAREMLDCMLSATAVFVGKEAMRLVYGSDPTPGANRSEHLARLWFRLEAAENLFADVQDKSAPSSITALREEVLAVSNGEKPRLMAKVSNRKGTYRCDMLRLRALGWEAYLRKTGMSAGQAQDLIKEGFGVTWPAIFGWKDKLRQSLGEENVDLYLYMAERGLDVHYTQATDIAASIRADGQALVAEEHQVLRENSLSH